MAETVPVKKNKSVVEQLEMMQSRIMQRAHELFRTNGGSWGRDVDDWLQAEREIVWKPPIELEEKDDEFRLQVAMPGVDPKDVDIEVSGEDIMVRANLRHEHKEERTDVHMCEFASGNLFRFIHMPKKIDPDKTRAEFKNGMLTLKAPVVEEARSRKIKVA